MQFLHGNARHAQLPQESVALEILVTDVNCAEPGNHEERIAAEAGKRLQDRFQLVGEQDADKNKASAVEQRTRGIEEEKSRSADARTASQGRRKGAQARNKLCRNNA